MDETKIEQLEATPEVEAEKVEAVAEAPEAEDAPAVEAPAEETVAEGCEGEKCDSCEPKKEPEDDEKEKKVQEGVKEEHKANQRKEVEKEQSKDLLERMEEVASSKVADIVIEAISKLPIEEGASEEERKALEEGIYNDGLKLLAHTMDVIEEVVAGTTMELNGHQVEVKDFYKQGGNGAGATAPAGVNAPVKAEDDEHEKKVKINAYHEGAEEIDYKSKYAESEATMDDLVGMIEETAGKYTQLAEEYAKVVKELQAYKLVEAHSILLEDAMDLLNDYSYEEVVEELVRYEEGEVIAENCEEKAEEKQEEAEAEEKKEEAEEKKEEKEEEKKEEAEEKAEEKAEEIKESIDGEVIAEAKSEPYIQKVPTFSVFKREVVSESKPSRKAWSAFAD